MWCVGELRLDHIRHDVGHRFGGLETDAFAKMNPNRTVPVLQDGKQDPIWETGAILRYLAAAYGSSGFWPDDPANRVQIDKWAEWAKINVAMAFTVPIFWRVVRTPAAEQNPEAITDALSKLTAALTIADEQLSQTRFLAGDRMTLADIQLGHILYRYFDIEIHRKPLAHLRRYYEDLSGRPAYRQHVMVSYEELRTT